MTSDNVLPLYASQKEHAQIHKRYQSHDAQK